MYELEPTAPHLALIAALVGGLDAADGERESALVLEEEGAEATVAREGVGAHREDVHVAVTDPRYLRFRGEGTSKGGEVGFMLEIDPLPFGCRGTCLPHKSSSRKGPGREERSHIGYALLAL